MFYGKKKSEKGGGQGWRKGVASSGDAEEFEGALGLSRFGPGGILAGLVGWGNPFGFGES